MKRLSSLLIVAMLAACSGGGGGNSLPSTPSAPHSGNGTMSLKVSFNRSGSNAVVRGGKRRNYVSYSTQGLGIDIVAHVNNGTPTLPKTTLSALRTPELAVAIAPGHTGNNVSCSAAVAGAFSCTILVPAPAGYDDVQITAWDQAPDNGVEGLGGTFNGTGTVPNDLSTNFLSQQLVLANQSNSFNFTMDGVVSSVSVTTSVTSLVSGASLGQSGTITTSLNSGSFPGNTVWDVQSVVGLQPGDNVTIGAVPSQGSAGTQETLTIATVTDGPTPSITTTTGSVNTHGGGDPVTYTGPINPATVTMTVNEFDAQGNRILGSDPLVDANGNAVTVTVQPAETNPSGGQIGDTGSAITLTAAACNVSNVCTYTTPDGSAQVGYNGYDLGSVQFAPVVSCGSATCASPTGTLQANASTIAFTRTTNGGITIPGPQSTLQIAAGEGASPLIGAVALGSDGDDWFGVSAGGGGGTNVGHIFKVAPGSSPTPQDFDLTASACDISGGVNSIAAGADNAMWFAGADGSGNPVLCSMNTNGGSVRSFGNLGFATGSFTGMAMDSLGQMWVVATDSTSEGWALAVDTTGTVVKNVDLGPSPGASQVTIGAADGQVYVALANGIAKIDPSASSPTVMIPVSGVAMKNNGYGIASTQDGLGGQYIFLSEAGSNGSSGFVDRYDGTSWTQAAIPGSTTFVLGLSSGPDGNVYAATDSPEVGRIHPATFPAQSSIATMATGRSWALAPGSDNSMWLAQWQTGFVTKIALP